MAEAASSDPYPMQSMHVHKCSSLYVERFEKDWELYSSGICIYVTCFPSDLFAILYASIFNISSRKRKVIEILGFEILTHTANWDFIIIIIIIIIII
jgi:hypothetical protein